MSLSNAIEEPETTEASSQLWGTDALDATRASRRELQSKFAAQRSRWIDGNSYFYGQVARLLRYIIEPGASVLNIRCQNGFFLDTVRPGRGVGIELTESMVETARKTHPEYEYRCEEPEDLELDEVFDYVLFNDVSDTTDVLASFKSMRPHCNRHSRVVVYTYNSLWEPILKMAEKLGLKMPQVEPNWLSEKDTENLLRLAGFEVLRTYRSVLCPKWIPIISFLFNRFFAKLPIIERFCMLYVLVARPVATPVDDEIGVSVIIPCKNERENVRAAVERIPALGDWTEIVFCDDKSTDGTADEVRAMQHKFPDKRIRLVDGPGICKADNVWTGFRSAKGDVLAILDGDLTVMPEELSYFIDPLLAGDVEFANGSRLVYPMQKGAMKWSNHVGNWFFATIFTFLLGQRVKDSLCGTKVLWRRDWQRIEPLIGTWRVKDRWGDFELLLGASRRHLRLIDVPVHYQERIYGVTKMTQVLKNGWNMLKICLSAGFHLRNGY